MHSSPAGGPYSLYLSVRCGQGPFLVKVSESDAHAAMPSHSRSRQHIQGSETAQRLPSLG